MFLPIYYIIYFILSIAAIEAEPQPVSSDKPSVSLVYTADNTLENYKLNSIDNMIDQLQKDRDLRHASWGFCLMDAKTGQVLTGYDIHRSLTPASTLKTLGTGVIFTLLDPDYQFETLIQYDGTLDKETGFLNGNIYIKGGGDPTLASGEIRTPGRRTLLNRWTRAIKDAGIKRINGKVIGDSRFFEDDVAPSSWSYGDMGNYYGASATGLTFNDNTFRIFFKSGSREGHPTELVNIEPDIPGLKIHNIVTTGAYNSWDNAYVHGAPLNDLYVIKGTIPPGRKLYGIRAAIPDPPLFVASQLYESLKRAGIEITDSIGVLRASDPQPVNDSARVVIYSHKSPRLFEIVKEINEESNNLYAEHILKLIGKQRYGVATTEKGVDAVMSYYRSKGLNSNGMHVFDGSGLSRKNAVTPYQMAKSLSIIFNDTTFNDFYNTLAIAGHTGTFMGMCGNLPSGVRENVRGKSGTISGVKSYVGYVKNYDGQMLTFAMIANNYTCSNYAMRNKWERLMCRIINVQEM